MIPLSTSEGRNGLPANRSDERRLRGVVGRALPTTAGAKAAPECLFAQSEPNWTMLSPAALIEPGPRSAQFRRGGDQLRVDAEGNSRISVADYALAMLDELELPRHINRRFTLAY